jgi:hypothetical protein
MKKPKSKSKSERNDKNAELDKIARALTISLIEAKFDPEEATFILVISLAIVVSNYGDVRTVQDAVDHWRRVSVGSEGVVREVASKILDMYYRAGGG